MDAVILSDKAATSGVRRVYTAIRIVFSYPFKSVLLITVLALNTVLAPANAKDPVAVDYDRDIRPILAEHCYACHGPDEKQREADLRLDVSPGGRQSNAMVPGKPDQSTVVKRLLESDESLRMPPAKTGKRLSAKQIELIQKWIAEGAAYSTHWAFAPLRQVQLPASTSGTATDGVEERPGSTRQGWIDVLLESRWAAERMRPAPETDRRTLARRLAIDLTGMPPTIEEVDEFLASSDPLAYEQLVERLLSSPQFGERMAMYWLDLVRYADTVGYHGDQEHQASPYRDYVIDAFNRDLPFDQFTREQLAGDLLPTPTPDQITATCYNRLLQTSHEGGVQPKEYLTIYAADRVRNLSSVWLAATIGCAQCHDHKYDPYTTRDFYSLAAFFADVDEERHLRGEGGDSIPTKRFPETPVLMRRERERLNGIEAKLTEQSGELDAEQQAVVASLTSERDAIRKRERSVMVTRALSEPRTIRILPRGNWLDESGEIVSPATPAIFGELSKTERLNRLDLANWLMNAQEGAGAITARVFVNRIWYLLFGAGLSRSLEDFGAQGDAPTHPELLDRLASEFIRSGWDVKQLIRRIVSSKAYRRSSVATSAAIERDPDNRYFARQGRWRLPAESIRDACLAGSSLLVREIGGRSARPYQPAGYYRYLNFPQREYREDADASQWRRGVYVHWQRQYLHPMLKAFDAPSREECTAQRSRSNTPLAALVLLNDRTFIECARVLAQRTLVERTGTDEEKVDWAFRQVTSRPTDPTERAALIELLREARAAFQADDTSSKELAKTGISPQVTGIDTVELAAWTHVCRALMNLSEAISRE